MDIGRSLLTSTNTEEVLRNIASGICDATGYERAVIVQYDRETGQLVGRTGYGVPADDVVRIRENAESVPIFSAVQRSRGPLVVPSERVREAIPPKYADIFHAAGTLVVNALNSDRLGLLGVVFTDLSGLKFEPSPHELDTLQDYADLAALSFQNALLFEQSKELSVLLERSRIAAELHDGVTQEVFGASLDVAELRQLEDLPRTAWDILERLAARIDSGSRQLRSALFELAQNGQDFDSNMTVTDAVRMHVEEFANYSGIAVDIDSYGDGPEPAGFGHDLAIRTVREGLANVAKHANATQSRVILRRGQSWWTVEVLDDGTGDVSHLRVDLTDCTRSSFGLRSLATDATRIGGRLWISSAPELGGMRVSVSVPVGRMVETPVRGC